LTVWIACLNSLKFSLLSVVICVSPFCFLPVAYQSDIRFIAEKVFGSLFFSFFFFPKKYLIYPISKYELKLNYYFSFSFNEAWQRSLKPFEQQKGKDMSFFLACPHKREEGGFELVTFASLGVVFSRLSYSFGDIKDRV
jgi:hypothetical protein